MSNYYTNNECECNGTFVMMPKKAVQDITYLK